MAYFVKVKDGATHRTEDIRQAYYYFGWECAKFEFKMGQRLEISDWPEEFYENTYCIAFLEMTDPIRNAVVWITARE